MWLYNKKELQDTDILESYLGFIYKITHISSGKYYIGRKNLDMAAYKTVKGVKKKIRKPSNWKEYYSSSPDLLKEVAINGKAEYKREILIFCSTKAQMLLAEEYFLHITGSMFDMDCYNQNIRSTIYKKWFNKTPNFFSELQSVDY